MKILLVLDEILSNLMVTKEKPICQVGTSSRSNHSLTSGTFQFGFSFFVGRQFFSRVRFAKVVYGRTTLLTKERCHGGQRLPDLFAEATSN